MRFSWKIFLLLPTLAPVGYLFYPIVAPYIENRSCEFNLVDQLKLDKIRKNAAETLHFMRKKARLGSSYTIMGQTGGRKTVTEFLEKYSSGNAKIVAMHELITGLGGIYNGGRFTNKPIPANQYALRFEYKIAPFHFANMFVYLDPKTLFGRWGSARVRMTIDESGQFTNVRSNPSFVIFAPTILERGSFLLQYKGKFRACPPLFTDIVKKL